MRVVMFTTGRFAYGGVVTYSYHFQKALESVGVECELISHKDRCVLDKKFPLRYPEQIVSYINGFDVLVINGCFFEKENIDRLYSIFEKVRIPIVVIKHDPAEKMEVLEKIKDVKLIITISKQNKKKFSRETTIPVEYTYHPYKRWSNSIRNQRKFDLGIKKEIISTSRMDFDKYYESILLAAESGNIPNYKIYTGYVHRPYIYFKLSKKVPIVGSDPFTPDKGWRRKYLGGAFKFTKQDYRRVYDHAKILIDMSYIKGDGGRSQYTWLEAQDYGLPVIISERWDPKEIYWKDGKNCVVANPDSPQSIGSAVKRLLDDKDLCNKIIANGYRNLKKKHSLKRVGHKLKFLLSNL